MKNSAIKMQLNIEKEGFLWISDEHCEAWKAYFNGRQVKLFQALPKLKSVYLPKGEGELQITYRTQSQKNFLLFFMLIIVLIISYYFLMINNLMQISSYFTG